MKKFIVIAIILLFASISSEQWRIGVINTFSSIIVTGNGTFGGEVEVNSILVDFLVHGEMSVTDSAATNIAVEETYQHTSNNFGLLLNSEVSLLTDSLQVTLTSGNTTDTLLVNWQFTAVVESGSPNNKIYFQVYVNNTPQGVHAIMAEDFKSANREKDIVGNGLLKVVNGDVIYFLVTDNIGATLGIESVHFTIFEIQRIIVNT